MKKIIISLLFTLLFSFELLANNIQIANISLTGQNTTSGFTMIEFDITWENSWRINTFSANWDAAWVFVKYRIGSGPWLHAFLDNSGHVVGAGTEATITPGLLNTATAFNATTNPAMGAFVHRSGVGAGTFTQTNMQLRWNYGANGITDGEAVEIKIFAVEMVYVPGGSFQLGDGTTTSVQAQFRNGSTNTPLTINSEGQLTLGGATNGNLANNNNSGIAVIADDFNNGNTKVLPAGFPKGFNAFYCMKYEISQQQWIDFFNVLSNAQKTARDITATKGDALLRRNNISWTSGDATLNGGTLGNVACNYLSWMDGVAFADWASLRPMSELEFEKAGRGSITPVANEYAWGSTAITGATGISNSGAINEVASNAGANVVFNNHPSVQGPLRVGSFATATSSRSQAGASYYGIMDLSGNLWERTVSVGLAANRTNFTAPIHGNGLLTSDGFCDIATWPGFASGKITGASGVGARGGGWYETSLDCRVSSRVWASSSIDNRYLSFGFRAVRTAQ